MGYLLPVSLIVNCNNETPLFSLTGTIAPARETSEKDNPLLAMLMNPNLMVPAAAAILVIIAAIVVICVLKGRNNTHKGSSVCGSLAKQLPKLFYSHLSQMMSFTIKLQPATPR